MARYIKIDSIKDKAISESKVDLPIVKGEGVDSAILNSSTTNIATGSNAAALGYNCAASGSNSLAAGRYDRAQVRCSVALGWGNITRNEAELIIGCYGVSNFKSPNFGDKGNTVFIVGVGNSNIKKNALEVHQDGSFFVKDLGGYDGTNGADIDNIKTLQEVINDLMIRIEALEAQLTTN